MHILGLVIATCKELGIAVIAYSYALFFSHRHRLLLTANSPLGHGLLSGHIKSRNDLAEDDARRTFSRFHEDVSLNAIRFRSLSPPPLT